MSPIKLLTLLFCKNSLIKNLVIKISNKKRLKSSCRWNIFKQPPERDETFHYAAFIFFKFQSDFLVLENDVQENNV